MIVKTLFLDCDGVINEFCPSVGFPVARWAKPECIEQLNRILAETDARVVISSTWRKYVFNGYMNLGGFRILMMALGVGWSHHIVGFTSDGPLEERGLQIRRWLNSNPVTLNGNHGHYAALDDMELGHGEHGIPLVQTDGRVGLTAQDADRAIAMLNGSQ